MHAARQRQSQWRLRVRLGAHQRLMVSFLADVGTDENFLKLIKDVIVDLRRAQRGLRAFLEAMTACAHILLERGCILRTYAEPHRHASPFHRRPELLQPRRPQRQLSVAARSAALWQQSQRRRPWRSMLSRCPQPLQRRQRRRLLAQRRPRQRPLRASSSYASCALRAASAASIAERSVQLPAPRLRLVRGIQRRSRCRIGRRLFNFLENV